MPAIKRTSNIHSITITNGLAIGYDERLIVRPPDDATTTLDYSPGNGDPVMSIQPES